MCQISQIGISDLLSGLIGSLLGALVGFRAAMESVRSTDARNALNNFKQTLLPVMQNITKAPENCPLPEIESCISASEILCHSCANKLRKADRLRLNRLWLTFKYGNASPVNADEVEEYLSSTTSESVLQNRTKALERLRALIMFEPKE